MVVVGKAVIAAWIADDGEDLRRVRSRRIPDVQISEVEPHMPGEPDQGEIEPRRRDTGIFGFQLGRNPMPQAHRLEPVLLCANLDRPYARRFELVEELDADSVRGVQLRLTVFNQWRDGVSRGQEEIRTDQEARRVASPLGSVHHDQRCRPRGPHQSWKSLDTPETSPFQHLLHGARRLGREGVGDPLHHQIAEQRPLRAFEQRSPQCDKELILTRPFDRGGNRLQLTAGRDRQGGELR